MNFESIDFNQIEKDKWTNWVAKAQKVIDSQGEEVDRLQKGVFEVMKVAVENEQYRFPDNEGEIVKRVVRVNSGINKEMLKKIYGIDAMSIWGYGIYILMEGAMISPGLKKKSGYLEKGRGIHYDYSCFPEQARIDCNPNLAIPAIGGLFIPKRTDFLNEYIEKFYQLTYFELNSRDLG